MEQSAPTAITLCQDLQTWTTARQQVRVYRNKHQANIYIYIIYIYMIIYVHGLILLSQGPPTIFLLRTQQSHKASQRFAYFFLCVSGDCAYCTSSKSTSAPPVSPMKLNHARLLPGAQGRRPGMLSWVTLDRRANSNRFISFRLPTPGTCTRCCISRPPVFPDASFRDPHPHSSSQACPEVRPRG